MIWLNICKDTEIKDKSLRSVKHQSLRRNLHKNTVTSGLYHLMEVFLDHIGFRSCILRRNHFITNDCLDSSDQTYFISGIFQNGFYHISSSSLSLSSCNTDCFKFLRRMAKICSGNKCHCISCIFHKNNGYIFRCFYSFLYNQYLCSFCDHIRSKFMTVHYRTSDTDKKRTFFDFSGVVNNILYFLVCTALKSCIFQSF